MNTQTATILNVAKKEQISYEKLRNYLETGEAIILDSPSKSNPVGIGKGLLAKISANIGLSKESSDYYLEIEKAKLALSAGADLVMDLSVTGDFTKNLRELANEVDAPISSQPIFQATVEGNRSNKLGIISASQILRVIEKQAEAGVNSITVHCALNRKLLEKIVLSSRLISITSRAGAILAKNMEISEKENPLYAHFDEVLSILLQYNIGLSIGNVTRSASIVDMFGELQQYELSVMGEMVTLAREKGVPVRVEAPLGHIRLDQIPHAVEISKRLCNNAPIGALGPLVTDIGLGFDHIVHAIGGAIAISKGLDFVSVITGSEHIGQPELHEVEEGVLAAKVAAHAGDVVRLGDKVNYRDREMSLARINFNREKQVMVSINPKYAYTVMQNKDIASFETACSMCGVEFCPLVKMSRAENYTKNCTFANFV